MQKEDCKCNRDASFLWGVEVCLLYLRSIHAIGIEWWKLLMPFFILIGLAVTAFLLNLSVEILNRAKMKSAQEARHREAARLRREDLKKIF